MATRGTYGRIPVIMKEYDENESSYNAREWLSDDDGGLYYVKSDGKTIISLYDTVRRIMEEHEKDGAHTNLHITNRVLFDKGFKIKVGGDFMESDIVTIKQNIDDDGNEVINTINISKLNVVPITSGGTGTKSFNNGIVMKKSGTTYLEAGTAPVSFGGTGKSSWTTGAVWANASSSLTSGTLPVTFGGTGKSSWTTGAVWANKTTSLTSGTLPVNYGGTGANNLGTGVVYANGTKAFKTLELSTYNVDSVYSNNESNEVASMKSVRKAYEACAIKNHRSTERTYGIGTDKYFGHVKIYNSTVKYDPDVGYLSRNKPELPGSEAGMAVGPNTINCLAQSMYAAFANAIKSKAGQDGIRIIYMSPIYSSVNGYDYIHCELTDNRTYHTAMNSGANGTNPFAATTVRQSALGIHIWVSDARLKKDIVRTEEDNALSKILSIDHKSFTFIKSGAHVKLGYVAQELEQIDKSFTTHVLSDPNNPNIDKNDDRNFTYQVNESGIIPYITKAIQEFYSDYHEEKEKLEKENVDLRNEIDDLKSRIEQLERLFSIYNNK